MSSIDYFEQKRRTAGTLADKLTAPIATKTSSPVFDAYCRQTFLDNVLRGGWPVHLGNAEKPVTYHIYSRKHGDPERDYNAFFLAAEYYSQGNGNYRDINQNRRSEIFFDPRVEDANIRSFMSLIQADGYNPLVVKGSRSGYRLKSGHRPGTGGATRADRRFWKNLSHLEDCLSGLMTRKLNCIFPLLISCIKYCKQQNSTMMPNSAKDIGAITGHTTWI